MADSLCYVWGGLSHGEETISLLTIQICPDSAIFQMNRCVQEIDTGSGSFHCELNPVMDIVHVIYGSINAFIIT